MFERDSRFRRHSAHRDMFEEERTATGLILIREAPISMEDESSSALWNRRWNAHRDARREELSFIISIGGDLFRYEQDTTNPDSVSSFMIDTSRSADSSELIQCQRLWRSQTR